MIKVVSKHWHRGMGVDAGVYIGRPSIFGNPFSHLDNTIAKYKVSSVNEAIEKYKVYFDDRMLNDPEFSRAFDELYKQWKRDGKLLLVCWCKPRACHGDYILEKLEAYDVIVGTSFD